MILNTAHQEREAGHSEGWSGVQQAVWLYRKFHHRSFR
jgi:hypothetical protein